MRRAVFRGQRVELQVAVVAYVDAAGVGGEVPGTEKEDGDSCEDPQEKLDRESGHEGLMELAARSRWPGEEESAQERDGGGECDAEESGDETFLEA